MPYYLVVNTLFYKILPLVILIIWSVPKSASADVTDFKVNRDGGITEQNHPAIAVAADGSFVIAWSDKRLSGQDIFLQRFSSDASPLGENMRVNDDSDPWTYQAEPAIAGDISGLYSVVWKDYRNGNYPFDPAIYFQRYDSAVARVGINRDLTANVPDSLKESPDIALSPWGSGVVVWADYRNRNWDIYGQRISTTGARLGEDFKINDDVGLSQQHAPRVSISPDGWFVVVWYDNRAKNDDILVQLYDSLANPLGNNFTASVESSSARQAFPDVAADGTGHFAVVWVDWRNGVYPGNPDIYYAKFDTARVRLGPSLKISTDPLNAPQREVSISLDRMGHAAIVWADSNATSWDITGQMIDVDGELHGENFRVNSSSDSLQLHPDVALDGRRRFTTWADKRNGHFDVYASISVYNEPQLVPDPTQFRFTMDLGSTRPPTQTLSLEHAGYNTLDYKIIPSHDWLSISSTAGQTPAQLQVGIATDTLAFGTYIGSLTLIDLDNSDSSVVVSVRLDVQAPLMELSSDTLSMRAFAGIDEYRSASITIGNGGTGHFNWIAVADAQWLKLSDYSGTEDQTVDLLANALDLSGGRHQAWVYFSSAESVVGADSLLVILEVIDNQPYLRLTPDSIFAYTETPGSFDTTISISNIGVGQINWQAVSSEPWLILEPSSGGVDESVRLTLEVGDRLNGLYTAYIDFTDSASFSITERLPFVLQLFVPPPDTISFGSTILPKNQPGVVPVELWCNSEIKSISLPIGYNPDDLTIDSFILAPSFDPLFNYSIDHQSDFGLISLNASLVLPDSFLTPGHYLLGELFITGGANDIRSAIDTAVTDTSILSLMTSAGERVLPKVYPGEIVIGTPTGFNQPDEVTLPTRIGLHQNYPNPFNLMTTIRYSLPLSTHVTLEIFNILGQRVTILVDDNRSVGTHQAIWNGIFSSGRIAPSGIYFYRLTANGQTSVKKLVLIK